MGKNSEEVGSNRDWHTASELYQERKLEMDREEGAETQRSRRTKIRGRGDRDPGRGGLGPREGARDQLRRRQKTRDRGGGQRPREGRNGHHREKWDREPDRRGRQP